MQIGQLDFFCFISLYNFRIWKLVNFASSLRKLYFRKKKFEILALEYSEWSKTSRNMIFSWHPDICVCICVYVLDFIIFKPLQFINGLRCRVEIWYSSEAVTPLQSWQFFWKLTPDLRFYGISIFLKNVCGSSKYRKVWSILLKLHKNIIYRSRTFGIEFHQNRLERSIFLRFWIFFKFTLNCVTCANFELLSSKFVYECNNTEWCLIRNLVRISRGL